jgi:hypothetical protein
MALPSRRVGSVVALTALAALTAPPSTASALPGLRVVSTATVEVVEADLGAVNRTGIAFTSARIRCSGADHVQGRARLTQLTGLTRVRAFASRPTAVDCDGKWHAASLVFAPVDARFTPGHASYNAGFVACDRVACRAAPTPSQSIRLRHTG